jgi:ATP-dependent helicase/nuclease subunit A
VPNDRNLLIEAGAGTGKTTRLVKAILQALFIRQISLDAIVALTFTNKAAGELKERVGKALEDVLSAKTIDALKEKPWWPTPSPPLTLTDLQKLATEAVSVLDRANISTIHSFAFSLLKRYPLAAGIDPEAEIDDKGLRFDDHFRREWPVWLMEELGEQPPREGLWMEIFSKLTLSEVEEAARRLADFEVPLEHLRQSEAALGPRLKELHGEIRALSAAHPGTQKADGIARACEEIIGLAAHGAWKKLDEIAAETVDILEKKPGDPTAAWNEMDLTRLKHFLAVAKNIDKRGDRVIALLTEALAPFVLRFRQVLLTEGCLTHSALLYLSRELVKNNGEIREVLKRSIRLILIDEFQDTDPLQAELLLYLAEVDGRKADHWETVQLEQGKLFIVGDPKQSIYRFRGADIAAYEQIGRLILSQGGQQETLEMNYRSQSQVIELVNQAFERIIRAEEGISPPYVAVKPHHPHASEHPVQDVAVWLADSPEEQSVETAQATEAEAAARWIKDSVGQLTIYDPEDGARRPMLYRDVALIFRTYSPMDRFIEALRRYDIPFAVESERYFFTTPEVTDFVNLLRAAENPDDVLSLVGYLRSPMGGLTDEEILKRKNADSLEDVASVRWLRTITARLGREPLAEVLQSIFHETFILEMAARSYHGDQTVANLLKLRRLLESFAAEGVTTMGLLLETLEEFFNDDKIEGESPLADEKYDAVRLLTIHKAKGLEYPVVFLPSLHSELKTHLPDSLVYDWRSRKLGLSVAGYSNLEKLLLDEQTRRRDAAEENRILYVAMTRARERLVLSGGVNLKSRRSRTYLRRLVEAWGLSLDSLGDGRTTLGCTSIDVRRLKRVTGADMKASKLPDNPLQRVDVNVFAQTWMKRAEICKQTKLTTLVLSPSLANECPSPLVGEGEDGGEQKRYAPPTSPPLRLGGSADASVADILPHKGGGETFGRPLLIGSLVHRFLEHWDFVADPKQIPARLAQLAGPFFNLQGLPIDAELIGQAAELLTRFADSADYKEIQASEIVGREVPFFYLIDETVGAPLVGARNSNKQPADVPFPRAATRAAPTDRPPTLVRGVMDILYRRPDGQLVIGDYKTQVAGSALRVPGEKTDVTGSELRVPGSKPETRNPKRVTRKPELAFEAQRAAYVEAVRRALGEDAIFKIIPLGRAR